MTAQAVAVQAAQAAKGRDLKVTLTLPVLPTGLTADGLYVLQSAYSHGVKVTAALSLVSSSRPRQPRPRWPPRTRASAHAC